MFAANFFNEVDLDLFPHNLIIPSPPTNSFAIDYQKCEFLERTFSSVCDNILLSTIESALQPHEPAFDYCTEIDPTFPISRVCGDVKEFACQARPKLKKKRAAEQMTLYEFLYTGIGQFVAAYAPHEIFAALVNPLLIGDGRLIRLE